MKALYLVVDFVNTNNLQWEWRFRVDALHWRSKHTRRLFVQLLLPALKCWQAGARLLSERAARPLQPVPQTHSWQWHKSLSCCQPSVWAWI